MPSTAIPTDQGYGLPTNDMYIGCAYSIVRLLPSDLKEARHILELVEKLFALREPMHRPAVTATKRIIKKAKA